MTLPGTDLALPKDSIARLESLPVVPGALLPHRVMIVSVLERGRTFPEVLWTRSATPRSAACLTGSGHCIIRFDSGFVRSSAWTTRADVGFTGHRS